MASLTTNTNGHVTAVTTRTLTPADIGAQTALTNPVTGTGTSNRLAYWNGTNTISDDSNLLFDPTNNIITLLTTANGIGLKVTNTTNDATTKAANYGIPHYLNAEEDFVGLRFSVSDIDNIVNIGGGSSLGNSATQINFITSSNNTTLNGSTRWSVLSSGILQSTGAQTIQTSTGNLTIATAAGNGNILLSAHGTGRVRISSTIDNATGNFATYSATGVFQQRTAAQVLSDISGVSTTRTITTNNGITGGGDLTANRTLGLTGQALALHSLGTNGLIVRTGSGTVAARSIVSTGGSIIVTNADGVSGNIDIDVDPSVIEW